MKALSVTQEYLLQHFNYNPTTGEFVRCGRKLKPCKARCRTVRIEGKQYYVHRLIWLLETGEDPGELEVDHIDKNPRNNKWENLRLLDRSSNQLNNNHTCISFSPGKHPYRARIRKQGIVIFKSHKTLTEAELFVNQTKLELIK